MGEDEKKVVEGKEGEVSVGISFTASNMEDRN